MSDQSHLLYNPSEPVKEDQLIPEGKQLFTLFSAEIGPRKRPRKIKSAHDFNQKLSLKWEHNESGKILDLMDNNQRYPFNRHIWLKISGAATNLPEFYTLMSALCKPWYQKEDEGGNIVGQLFTHQVNGQDVLSPYDDEKYSGPLGMPIWLYVVHVKEPVRKLKDGAQKNNFGQYDDEQYEFVLIDDGENKGQIKTRIVEKLVATKTEEGLDYVEFVKRGWPTFEKVEPETPEAEIRGNYDISYEDPTRVSDIPDDTAGAGDAPVPEAELTW